MDEHRHLIYPLVGAATRRAGFAMPVARARNRRAGDASQRAVASGGLEPGSR
jgi:hypothetical protein